MTQTRSDEDDATVGIQREEAETTGPLEKEQASQRQKKMVEEKRKQLEDIRRVLSERSNGHYAVLDIQMSTRQAGIVKRYKALSLRLHPDKNKQPGAEAAFKCIGEAKEVLCDEDARSKYDLELRQRNEANVATNVTEEEDG